MPNLGLTGDEVASLVAFINASRASENAVVVEPTTCKVTRANGQGTFLEGMSPDLHGNALISTGLWPDGTVVFRPGGPGFVTHGWCARHEMGLASRLFADSFASKAGAWMNRRRLFEQISRRVMGTSAFSRQR